MLISVQSSDRLGVASLPDVVGGTHWITNPAGERLAHVEGVDGQWRVEAVEGCFLHEANQQRTSCVHLDPSTFAVINVEGPGIASCCLVFEPEDVQALTTRTFGFKGDVELVVGRSPDNAIVYESRFVSSKHAKLVFRNGKWYVGDPGSANGVYLNGRRIAVGKTVKASYGDVVSILGLRMTLGSGLISCNNPAGQVSVSEGRFVVYRAPRIEASPRPEPAERQSFHPALRFARSIEKKSFSVDAPPAPEKEERRSLLQRVGPSMLMGFASLMSACVFVMLMLDSNSTPLRAVPMVLMAVSMLAGSVVWPIINDRKNREERERKEAVRRGAYAQYLSGVLTAIAAEERLQIEILNENRISTAECLAMAARSDAHLMDRASLHADYLDVRIGVGDEPLVADIRFPEKRFSVDDDDLRKEVDALAEKSHILSGVPLAHPLAGKHIVGVVGPDPDVQAFARGIVVQLAALCSYEDVKIVVLCDESRLADWDFARYLPHVFSDDRKVRYFACGREDAAEVSLHLERVLEERRGRNAFEAREAQPYYVIVSTSKEVSEKTALVRSVVEDGNNRGMAVVALADSMQSLPRECRSVIGLEGRMGYLLDRDDPSGRRRPFSPDCSASRRDAALFSSSMTRLHLDLEVDRQGMPDYLGFMEMCGVGNVGHLNISSRWREANASSTLACCVGVDESGEPFMLNLHEKFHGPHGLIAGTTGSGKSEFIITWILSMALAYSPDDVAFVLIDYKGGGLARAFDNERVHLPHLAGVITNLDGAAIQRSLVSIQSELKRRQALFNRARDVVGGDNVDIYDYLGLYRQGRMDEPCPHLFIVADEFAELKQQRPEFMDELISAARIGRSLGVHLVLATQKPSGVVNEQIWSNARFKVCLKVSDAADSKEMIRRPDAAELQQAGRFFLLVGYNEQFSAGQAAYAGTRYVARDRLAQSRDDSVSLISNTGRTLVSVKPRTESGVADGRPESVAVLEAIGDVAAALGTRARQLWLEPLPDRVVFDGLAAKYGWDDADAPAQPAFAIDPVIGEYDDPNRQHQDILTLPLSEQGNALVYGTSDSGVECVLNALLYSLLRKHGADELNVYVLDFGSESCRAFASAPQVGDVIGIAEEEKVARFFDFMDAQFATRRAALAEYGGSFARYARASGELPAIVVALNDVAAFLETYPKLEDRLSRFIREAGRSGVYLVATAANSSSIRVRMRQSFRQILAVNLADAGDYGLIFGSMRGIPQPRGFGRGLVQLEGGVFEFQAANLSADGGDFSFALRFSQELCDEAKRAGTTFAQPIPMPPEVVTVDVLEDRLLRDARAVSDRAGRLEFVPYGIYEDDLTVAGFGFSETPLARCLFQRRKDGGMFLRALLAATARCCGGVEVAVLDLARLLDGMAGSGPKQVPQPPLPEEVVIGTVFGPLPVEDDGGTGPDAAGSIPAEPDAVEAISFYADDDNAVCDYLLERVFPIQLQPADGKADGNMLLVVTDVADFLTRAGFDFAGKFKDFLRSLTLQSKVRVLLVDAASSPAYTFEDWFKAHLTGKDGLWVGPGVESQTAIGINYAGVRFLPDSKMNVRRGYEVTGGQARLVRLVGIGEDAREGRREGSRESESPWA